MLVDKLDLECVTGLEAEKIGVSLAHHEVAVELNLGGVAELAPAFAPALTAAIAEADALGIEQGLIEGGEVKSLTAVFLLAHIASRTDELTFGNIPQLFDFGDQFGSGKGHTCVIDLIAPYSRTSNAPGPLGHEFCP